MRIEKLDGLRGIFSLMVLFFHYPQELLPAWLSGNFFIRESYTFVDFFFVLSGFVIALNYSSINSFGQFSAYMKKRFIRLYPLMLYTTLLMFFFKWAFTNFFPQYVQNPDVFGVLMLKTFDGLLLTNSFPVLSSSEGINIPSWSISAEFVAYISFGLIMVFIRARFRAWAFLALLLGGYIGLLLLGKTLDTSGDYGFLRALLAFNIGYFVYRLTRYRFLLPDRLEWLFPILLLLLFYLMDQQAEWSRAKQLLGLSAVPLFFGASIVLMLKTDGVLSRLLRSKPLVFLGDVSYSLYLNHWLLIILIPKGFFVALGVSQNLTTQLAVFGLTVLVALIYSYYTYRFIEKGFSTRLRKRFMASKPKG
jgi:peptidoglycan/LPS O-acetylase OafA/YrhL